MGDPSPSPPWTASWLTTYRERPGCGWRSGANPEGTDPIGATALATGSPNPAGIVLEGGGKAGKTGDGDSGCEPAEAEL